MCSVSDGCLAAHDTATCLHHNKTRRTRWKERRQKLTVTAESTRRHSISSDEEGDGGALKQQTREREKRKGACVREGNTRGAVQTHTRVEQSLQTTASRPVSVSGFDGMERNTRHA